MEPQEVKRKFKTRFIRQIIVAILLLPAIFVFVFVEKEQGVALQQFLGLESAALLYAAIGLVAAGLAFTLWNWRCPSCNKYLKKEIYPKHCSGCGIELHA